MCPVNAELKVIDFKDYKQLGPRRGVTEEVPAVGFCLGSGLFGSYNSD